MGGIWKSVFKKSVLSRKTRQNVAGPDNEAAPVDVHGNGRYNADHLQHVAGQAERVAANDLPGDYIGALLRRSSPAGVCCVRHPPEGHEVSSGGSGERVIVEVGGGFTFQ